LLQVGEVEEWEMTTLKKVRAKLNKDGVKSSMLDVEVINRARRNLSTVPFPLGCVPPFSKVSLPSDVWNPGFLTKEETKIENPTNEELLKELKETGGFTIRRQISRQELDQYSKRQKKNRARIAAMFADQPPWTDKLARAFVRWYSSKYFKRFFGSR
jgi:hypothetical protein